MTGADPDLFVEPHLRFEIRKPRRWSFMPPAWSPAVQLRNAVDEETEWLRYASTPFVCFLKRHGGEKHVYPTVQVSCRPSGVPDSAVAKQLLDAQAGFLAEQFADFELLEASSDRLIAGHRANSMRASYTLLAERDDEEREFAVLARSYTIFTPGIVFTLGMPSSLDPRHYDEDDFTSVLASVRIGRR